MKNMIFKVILAGAAFYILLMILESAMHPQIILPAVAGSVILAGLASVFAAQNDAPVHTGEVVLLWAMVLLFAGYGLLAFFGVIQV